MLVHPVHPVPPRRPTVLEAHDDRRVDDWYWLRDRDDPLVLAHLEAERAYADEALAPLGSLRDALFDEIRSRVVETDLSVPVHHGPWWYYRRTEEGKSYAIHCRRPWSDGDPPLESEPPPDETVLLDENALAQGHEYFRAANLAVSPSHDRLAFGVDTTGGELYDVSFRALAGNVPDATETLRGCYYGLAWASDDATVFYTRVDEAMRPYQVWRHRLGEDPRGDVLVLQEDDERFTVGVGRSRDGAYVLIAVESTTTSEWWAVPAGAPESAPRTILSREAAHEYSVDHHRGWFVVLTNAGDGDRGSAGGGAVDFRVVCVRAAGPATGPLASLADAVEIVPHRPGIRVEDVDVFDDWLVLSERLDGEPVLRIVAIPPDGVGALAAAGGTKVLAESRLVPTGEHPSATWAGANPEQATSALRVEQTSLVTPRTVSDIDLVTGTVKVRKVEPVRDYDRGRYRTYRMWATALDGAEVPISVVHRVDVPLPAPCLLYGYGAYEVSIDPLFSARRLPLLDRGVVFAIAHVRGGGELGRRWYLDGKAAAKHRTIDDFVACARRLIEGGITAPQRLAARGASAGGLLMGAVVNEAPELFAAIIAEVPFVDCLTTMLDESIPLTVGEFEEWGDPIRDAGAYATIKEYSPYDNVGPGPHPAIFATGALNDPRVGFWEPAKWVAKLRALDPDARVVFRPELVAGHGGRSGRYEAWRDEALVQAFVLDALGVTSGRS